MGKPRTGTYKEGNLPQVATLKSNWWAGRSKRRREKADREEGREASREKGKLLGWGSRKKRRGSIFVL